MSVCCNNRKALGDVVAEPQREIFLGGTKVDTGPQISLGPPSLIEAHAVKSFFVQWV